MKVKEQISEGYILPNLNMLSFLPMEHCSLIQRDFLRSKGNTSERDGGTRTVAQMAHTEVYQAKHIYIEGVICRHGCTLERVGRKSDRIQKNIKTQVEGQN